MIEPTLSISRVWALARAALRGGRETRRPVRAWAAPPSPSNAGGSGPTVAPTQLGLVGQCGPGVDPVTFRSIMSAFPTGVAVVTSFDTSGTPRGLTCSALCSVSIDPPLLLLCVNSTSGALQAIRASNGFVVNFLREGRDSISQLFASASSDKFSRIRWRRSAITGLPWLEEDTIAHADCRLVSDIEAGDHSILIGVLVSGSAPLSTAQPLLYWQRRYASWPVSREQRMNAAT
jgi:flavin reductase (NADH)